MMYQNLKDGYQVYQGVAKFPTTTDCEQFLSQFPPSCVVNDFAKATAEDSETILGFQITTPPDILINRNLVNNFMGELVYLGTDQSLEDFVWSIFEISYVNSECKVVLRLIIETLLTQNY